MILASLMALFMATDGAAMLTPPPTIRRCLQGVGFPEQWWWALSVVKFLAAGGLFIGVVWQEPLLTAATLVGVLAYFACATVAHLRAQFTRGIQWISCLVLLGFSVFALMVNLVAL